MGTNQKRGLGKGLGALFTGGMVTGDDGSSVTMLKIFEIEPNKEQPRKDFSEEALEGLKESIKRHGIVQPILVRPAKLGNYQIVAGERRWRASKLAGLTEVPVIIKEFTDRETMEIALIENLHREDLNIVEEGLGYKELMDRYNITQEEVAQTVGKSRSAVANAVRLLGLPDKVLDLIRANEISAGHARALLRIEDESEVIERAEEILEKGLSVRQIEKVIKDNQDPVQQKITKYIENNYEKSTNYQNPDSVLEEDIEEERVVGLVESDKVKVSDGSLDIEDEIKLEEIEKTEEKDSEKEFCDLLEKNLCKALRRNVKITSDNWQKKIEIEFFDNKDLVDLANRLCKDR